jgi:hypothetical protein
VTALAVLVGVFLLSLLPFFQTDALTTYVDQGTGGAGHNAVGRTYDLYAGMETLLQFPVPAQVLPAIVLLQFGPWQFNVMGLYVVLLLASPLILAALNRGKALWVLAATLGLYAVGAATRFRLLPSQFEDSFPLLVWQVLFVLGLVAGFHRHRIVAWLSARHWVVVASTVLAFVFAFLSWCTPYLANGFDVRLAIIPDAAYRAIYDALFARTYLDPGRLLNVLVLVVAAYAFLSAYWKPVERALGWFLIPLGQATLYVFILHVVLIAVIANIPALQQGQILINTAGSAVADGQQARPVRDHPHLTSGFEDQGLTLAAAAAQGHYAGAPATAFQRQCLVQHKAGPGGSHRMPQGDGPAVGVDLFGVNSQVLGRLQHHRGEGFVDLDKVQLPNGQPLKFQGTLNGTRRLGVQGTVGPGGLAVAADLRDPSQPGRLRRGLAGHHHSGRAIGER